MSRTRFAYAAETQGDDADEPLDPDRQAAQPYAALAAAEREHEHSQADVEPPHSRTPVNAHSVSNAIAVVEATQEELACGVSSQDLLIKAAILTREQYDEVVQERSGRARCGYASCAKAPAARALDYCSEVCKRQSMFLRGQLSDTPIHLRSAESRPAAPLLPFAPSSAASNGSIDDALANLDRLDHRPGPSTAGSSSLAAAASGAGSQLLQPSAAAATIVKATVIERQDVDSAQSSKAPSQSKLDQAPLLANAIYVAQPVAPADRTRSTKKAAAAAKPTADVVKLSVYGLLQTTLFDLVTSEARAFLAGQAVTQASTYATKPVMSHDDLMERKDMCEYVCCALTNNLPRFCHEAPNAALIGLEQVVVFMDVNAGTVMLSGELWGTIALVLLHALRVRYPEIGLFLEGKAEQVQAALAAVTLHDLLFRRLVQFTLHG